MVVVLEEETVKHREKSQGKLTFGQGSHGKVREFYSRRRMGTLSVCAYQQDIIACSLLNVCGMHFVVYTVSILETEK